MIDQELRMQCFNIALVSPLPGKTIFETSDIYLKYFTSGEHPAKEEA